MKSIRKWILTVFGFSGTEINGFLILLPLMLAMIVSEPAFHNWRSREIRGADQLEFDSLVALWEKQGPLHRKKTFKIDSPFHFDPNHVSTQDLAKLGFTDRLATRIAAYREKGGVFSTKSDLLRIYGLDSSLYNQLYDYINLPVNPVRNRHVMHAEGMPPRLRDTAPGPVPVAANKFDLNSADTLLLKSVYGIGSRLASRIVNFRESLGGFVHPDQLFEVYGLDSVVVARLHEISFVSDDFVPRRININTATPDILSAHPYIKYRLARLMVSYRFQHGDFRDVDDIKNLSGLDPQGVDRLLPYLKVGD